MSTNNIIGVPRESWLLNFRCLLYQNLGNKLLNIGIRIGLPSFIFIISLSVKALTPSQVILSGNKKTKSKIILNELNIVVGKNYSNKEIESAVQRVRNLNIFSKVDYNLNGSIIEILVEERWTTIPILKFSNGGGVSQFTLGVFDPNISGQYLEAGGQFQKLEETDSGVLWFKNPRLFGERKGIDLQFWKINRLRTKYEQGENDPIIKTGFLQTREKVYLAYQYEIKKFWGIDLYYEYNRDEFSTKLVPANSEGLISPDGLPPGTTVHFIGAKNRLGQIDFYGYLQKGLELQLNSKMAFSQTSGIDHFFQFDLDFKYYKIIYKDHTFAQRALIGATSTEVLQYWFYLGGLDRIRGFADNRFAGKYYWLSNSEYRIPIWKKQKFIIQVNGFLDLVGAHEELKSSYQLTGASVGTGLRLILPKIYRFVMRIDYAKPIKKEDDNAISLGVQQFF